MAITKRIENDSTTRACEIRIRSKSEAIRLFYTNDLMGDRGNFFLTSEEALNVVSEKDLLELQRILGILADYKNPDHENNIDEAI